MTRDEFILNLTTYAGDDYKDEQASLVESIIDDAIEEVRRFRYPFSVESVDELKAQTCEVQCLYGDIIRRISEYHYDKIGKEGVTTFYESGQTTSWESGGTPKSFFKGIVSTAKVV